MAKVFVIDRNLNTEGLVEKLEKSKAPAEKTEVFFFQGLDGFYYFPQEVFKLLEKSGIAFNLLNVIEADPSGMIKYSIKSKEKS